ncbi:SAM-dependent methyltransferase [Hamadaea tsunoensis]|uniref:SAM-dependent methyltransferase n=1 Tax=Hamadaea tsunoensis TaxID=53368 RepID=UPI0003F5C531|nr:cyclopropane-fatty-acyl-phospholipid synthase family protein [Hamadaea tsunoensis]
MSTIAEELVALVEEATGAPLPIGLIAWDGSEAGAATRPTLVIADRTAVRRLLWYPPELALAQAYILGEVDVLGDLGEGLSRVWQAFRGRRPKPNYVRALRFAAKHRLIGPKPKAPALQAALSGDRHSRARDRAAISYHYDLSNEFYELLLDPRMAYSCGYWTRTGDPLYGLAEAQADKLDLICGKLGLHPGARLLDVGCGWGSLSLHAAREYGAHVTAVTLSAQQYAFVRERADEHGLDVDVRLLDYRDLDAEPFDAVATVEMGEHVGEHTYPAFAGRLHELVKPGGRVLVQQMSRGGTAPGGGAFIESYIAPDMHMRPVGDTVSLLERAGLEVRDVHALREHYVLTARAWLSALEERWTEVVAMIGEPTARVWRLYLVGGALAFAERRMGVDQILAVRPTGLGETGLPLVRDARWSTAC